MDILYLLAALLTSPVWLYRMISTGKIKTDWPGRLGRTTPLGPSSSEKPRLLFHAVSVGEVNAIQGLVERLASDHQIVIATTTDTGLARATAIYGERHTVVRYPFDFHLAVRRFLNAVQPDAIALVELEVWPNFTAECQRRGIPVCVINGRLSERSFNRYQRVRALVAPSFHRLTFVAAQDEAIAKRFRALGVEAEKVLVAGTLKWDNAEIKDTVEGAEQLAADLGVDRSRPIVVAGSTGPGEEAMIHAAVPDEVQLLIAPRKPERFDDAARAMPGCVRRSAGPAPHNSNEATRPTRFLLDTLGELKSAYSLADVVIVGRTFCGLGGSDMIEPIALGKATIIGPDVANFQSVTQALVEGGGLIMVDNEEELPATIRRLLSDTDEGHRLGTSGRQVIEKNQGATTRHQELIARLWK